MLNKFKNFIQKLLSFKTKMYFFFLINSKKCNIEPFQILQPHRVYSATALS